MVKVKICGLSNEQTLTAAIDAGADFVGFVFFEPSPRNIDMQTAARLAEMVEAKAKKVALSVDASDEKIDAICAALKPDFIQAHGSESPERTAAIRTRTGVPIIKAIKVKNAQDIAAASRYGGAVDMILFDAKAPETMKNALPGGNAISFDWSLVSENWAEPTFMLSGGLNAANLREAVRITRAPIVDVSSGVETGPGVKSIDLIKAFMAVAKQI